MHELILSSDEKITSVEQARKRRYELQGWLDTYGSPRGHKEIKEREDVKKDVKSLEDFIRQCEKRKQPLDRQFDNMTKRLKLSMDGMLKDGDVYTAEAMIERLNEVVNEFASDIDERGLCE